MTKRAHIRNGEIVARFSSERGWLTLADGSRASPVVIGYENGPDKVVPIVEETVDNSATGYTTSSRTETVEPDRVLATTTIEDRPITVDMVNDERDRRISAGFVYAGANYQTRPADRENIAGASTAALGAIVNGAQAGDYRWHGGDTDFAWIAADNTTHRMDAHQMFAFGQAAMAHKEGLIFAARAIKDMNPIPADYADDKHWV